MAWLRILGVFAFEKRRSRFSQGQCYVVMILWQNCAVFTVELPRLKMGR
jgi:hypothetical protein